MKHHLAHVQQHVHSAEHEVQELEQGIDDTNDTWDRAQRQLADALHRAGVQWGVIKAHLDSPEFRAGRFDLDELVESLKGCKNCLQGDECEEHKIK